MGWSHRTTLRPGSAFHQGEKTMSSPTTRRGFLTAAAVATTLIPADSRAALEPLPSTLTMLSLPQALNSPVQWRSRTR